MAGFCPSLNGGNRIATRHPDARQGQRLAPCAANPCRHWMCGAETTTTTTTTHAKDGNGNLAYKNPSATKV
ncbi:hypothetical protein [Methylovulum sp.]|uniref:hypothetical protein n=1 Tax=Methylovulum sp. TaxID=1916980 RepID=UPI00261903A2|nr:hypothetical protein [Methylovulum sp.]MDD5125386.1 hypothetical protein [Methylovulum sp.]